MARIFHLDSDSALQCSEKCYVPPDTNCETRIMIETGFSFDSKCSSDSLPKPWSKMGLTRIIPHDANDSATGSPGLTVCRLLPHGQILMQQMVFVGG